MRDPDRSPPAIEREDAKSAGTLGFMTRALAIATLPHRRQMNTAVRKNGDFVLHDDDGPPRRASLHVPRMLLIWLAQKPCNGRARKSCTPKHPLAEIWTSWAMHSSRAASADIIAPEHAATTLFSAAAFVPLRGADRLGPTSCWLIASSGGNRRTPEQAGQWQSNLQLELFFKECIEHLCRLTFARCALLEAARRWTSMRVAGRTA